MLAGLIVTDSFTPAPLPSRHTLDKTPSLQFRAVTYNKQIIWTFVQRRWNSQRTGRRKCHTDVKIFQLLAANNVDLYTTVNSDLWLHKWRSTNWTRHRQWLFYRRLLWLCLLNLTSETTARLFSSPLRDTDVSQHESNSRRRGQKERKMKAIRNKNNIWQNRRNTTCSSQLFWVG